MNILEFKRRALGYTYRNDGESEGGDGRGGDGGSQGASGNSSSDGGYSGSDSNTSQQDFRGAEIAEQNAHDAGSGWGGAVNDLAPVGQAITGTLAEMAAVSKEMQDQSNAANVDPRTQESNFSVPTISSTLQGWGVPKGLATIGGLIAGAAVPGLGMLNGLAGAANLGLGAAREVGGLMGGTRNEVNEAAGISGASGSGSTASTGDGSYSGGSDNRLAYSQSGPGAIDLGTLGGSAATPTASKGAVDYTMYGHVDASGWGRAINDYASKKSAQRG